MVEFEYIEPNSLDEAIGFLSKFGDKAKICAGGTDLILKMKVKSIKPRYVVNIESVPDLAQISLDKKSGLRLGALTTLRSIEKSSELKENGYGILCQAASQMASVAIRNIATVGGNICNAAPSADMAPPLLTLSAKARVLGPAGERLIPLENFFTGPGMTKLESDEILYEIQIPPLSSHDFRGVYLKHSIRGSVDLATVGVAVTLNMEPNSPICNDAKIALGAVAPTPLRVNSAEDLLKGEHIDNDLIKRASQASAEEARPISDVRSSKEFRKKMIEVFTMRALKLALEKD